MMMKLLCTLLLNVVPQVLTSELVVVGPLKDFRARIGFIPYNASQRIQVAESVKTLFSIYVNRESKIAHYSKDYTNIDPIPVVDKILGKAAQLSDADFHYRFVDLFASLRDLHTTYKMPGPHKCVSLHQAIKFEVVGNSDNRAVIATGFNSKSILDLSPLAQRVTIGDRLLIVSGLKINDFIMSKRFSGGGTTDESSLRATLSSLSKIDGAYSRLPVRNSTKYTFLSTRNQIYSIELPWIGVIDQECWTQSEHATLGIPTSEINQDSNLESHNIKLSKLDFKDDLITSRISGLAPNSTSDPNIKWMIHDPNSKRLGIIIILAFEPHHNDIVRSIEIIRDCLLTDLAQTSAVLFDVRFNKGGSLHMAEFIPQLFANNVGIKSTARMLVTNTNREMVRIIDERRWNVAFDHIISSDRYSLPVDTLKQTTVNRLGQAYLKPVGIFTNSACFSTCEMFTAMMKDSAHAIVFGEDAFTGGSGSKKAEYNSYLKNLLPKKFHSLPFSEFYPLAAQDISVAWMQYIRPDGTFIEDSGVRSNHIIQPSASDFLPSSTSASQYDKIANILEGQGIKNRVVSVSMSVLPINVMVKKIGYTCAIRVITQVIRTIDITNEVGFRERIAVVNFDRQSPQINEFKIQTRLMKPRIHRFLVRGYDLGNTLIFSTWRSILLKPRLVNYSKLTGPRDLDFEVNETNICLYDDSASPNLGWTMVDDELRIIGSSETIDSTQSYFIYLEKSSDVLIQAEYMTRIENNSFEIGYYKYDGTLVYLVKNDNLSNRYRKNRYTTIDRTFQLPSGYVELFFAFRGYKDIIGYATIKTIRIIK